ncbi:GPI-anchored adhesin-like protein [Rhynchospora pubera]|uniref:GPI-anchored adhesin-like protein n=1 Tax=Rhynchospora pubera TaxID=906938 RepID=A0AAV8FXU4_9POAL|nr:GPI-anchored adhesin-like protein [Rhynchospora pubera]
MNMPGKLNKKTRDTPTPKQRSPLTDLNRTNGAGCFRFLKPTSNSKSSSTSTSNCKSNFNSVSNSKSNSSANSSSFLQRRPTRPVPKSAPPKKAPNVLKKKKGSEPVKPQHTIVIITPERGNKREERSGSTPPIQASISPEIPCGSSVAPTPVCFAAGHVVTGVVDRRKCRPRGILNIGNGSEVSNCSDGNDNARVSTSSPLLPPLTVGASIHWLSSPSEITNGDSEPRTSSTKCQAEASVDWFLSPHEKSSNGISSRFSPIKSESPFEKTPNSGSTCEPVIQKTPSSNSSISPFSIIVKRASESSVMKLSSSNQQIVDMKASSAGIFESINWSTSCKTSSGGNCILPPPRGSFQFRHDFTPFNSVDWSGFTNPNRATPETDKRISWREGLVSRINEMAEKDCCMWLSDCEDDGQEDEDPFEFNSKISIDHDVKCGLGSAVHAESITVEGEDELVASDDSDWRLLYKNQLFES